MSHSKGDLASARSVDISTEKDGAVYCEDLTTSSSANKQELPETLRDLSEDERKGLEKKLLRKIDLRLLPILVIMYILNYLDRNNIASARLAGKVGMEKELGMSSTEFNVRLYPLVTRNLFFSFHEG